MYTAHGQGRWTDDNDEPQVITEDHPQPCSGELKIKEKHMVRKKKDKTANDQSTSLKTPFDFVYYHF